MTDSTAIASAAMDADLRLRISAIAAQEGFQGRDYPTAWADRYQWAVVAQPGVADAYASAQAAQDPRPGWNLAAITDGMLLAAVTAVRNAQSGAGA